MIPLLLALLSAPQATPTPAPLPSPVAERSCDTVRAAVPPGFGGWSTGGTLMAGANRAGAPVMVIGRRADLKLAAFTPMAAPAKAPAPGTLGGLVQFEVRRAGTYRVGLGTAAWIEVIRGGTRLASVAHGHGPMCTGIRKIVDFRLTPGRYWLQLSGTTDASVPVLIARAAAR